MSKEDGISSTEHSRPHNFLMRMFASRSVPRKRPPKEGAADETATELGQPANPAKKILIVNDTSIILKSTSLKLKPRGHAVMAAMDGPVAITTVRK